MRLLLISIFCWMALDSLGQARLDTLILSGNRFSKLVVNNQQFILNRPLVTYEINQKEFTSDSQAPVTITFNYSTTARGLEGVLVFTNTSSDTVSLSNVVPGGREANEVYITGLGNHRLSRTHLFLPGKQPVNVIVPDNAWELGYTGLKVNDQHSLFALVRRDLSSLKNAIRRRFETLLAPGGSVAYNFYSNVYTGEWQNGLRDAFQHNYLYDVNTFDETLFKRADLAWIRKSYVMHLMMAWDKDFYDQNGAINIHEFIKAGKSLYGGDDVICLWPTWPTLGVDQRNQFDLYRDLPGGLNSLRGIADSLRRQGTKFFVAYNPWDESTRAEGHLQGLADLISATSADGVVLDTKGESSKELQQAADQVKPGVVMYSEGMAVPKDMPGIISGRVHNALYYPPLLNLNKFIRPDFSIFRVAEVYKEPIQREYAVAFFNGYGTEINQFAPGHPEWEEAQYRYLGKTTRILRENSAAFNQPYLPLLPTTKDSVWVNRWIDPERKKEVYTILSMNPGGVHAPLFEGELSEQTHWIDLWKHEEVVFKKQGDQALAVVNIDGFDARNLGTNNEGEVSCLARFKKRLNAQLTGDKITGSSNGMIVKLWLGNPAYDKEPLLVNSTERFEISIAQQLCHYEGKIVLQAFEQDELVDEQILFLKPGIPHLISNPTKTATVNKLPPGMVLIAGGSFKVHYSQGDEFIPYPKQHEGETIQLHSFAMDRYPVTNADFKRFLENSQYQPVDSANFLKHWHNGMIPAGQENFPVTYVAYEDAQAYATWAGKRLPTELEWQYAAQTSKGNEWPWKQTKPVTREETYVTETLTVKNIKGIDPHHANLGDGELYSVGKYKKGVNPNGLYDLSGCVWQLTNDVYESGSYRYIIMKGGSYFKPSSSWWYVQGGPRELHYRQFLLRVSPGFERNATVGFRCVKDVN